MPPKTRTRARGTARPRAARSPGSVAQRAARAQPAGRHAAPVPAPAAAQANRQAIVAATPRRDPVTVREAAGKGRQAAAVVTERRGGYSGRRMLTAELLIGIGIVAVRAVADYEPQADGTLKGKVGHPKGQYGPLPILAGLIVTFFLLSFLAASGGTKARLAVIAGGIVDLALLMKSGDEFTRVADTFGKLGHARRPAGSWQSTGTAAGEPVEGGSSSGGSSSGGADSPGARVGEPGDPNLLVPKNVLPQ
jgi:hypothetical protein